MAVTGAIVSLIAISQIVLNAIDPDLARQIFPWGYVQGMDTEQIARATGLAGGAFVTGVFLLIPLACVFALWPLRGKKSQLFWITVMSVLLCVGILSTVTRGAILAALAMLAIWMLVSRQSLKSDKRWFFAMVFAAGIVAVVYALGVGDVVASRFNPTESISLLNGNGRIAIWHAVFTAFSQLPPIQWFFGGGAGFSLMASVPAFGIPQVVHNQYLWLLFDTGIVGLFAYLAFVFVTLRTVITLMRRSSNDLFVSSVAAAFLAVFFAYHVVVGMVWGFTGSVLIDWFLLSFCGAILGLASKTERDQNEKQRQN